MPGEISMAYQRSLGGVGDVVSAAAAVVEDPCLLPVSQLLLRLHQLEQPARPRTSSTPAPAPSAPTKGVGLCYAVKPLRAAVWVRQRPWVLPVAGVALVGGLVTLGYLLRGRGR